MAQYIDAEDPKSASDSYTGEVKKGVYEFLFYKDENGTDLNAMPKRCYVFHDIRNKYKTKKHFIYPFHPPPAAVDRHGAKHFLFGRGYAGLPG